MAKDIFSKIIRDYNNDLEVILEKKDFESDVKNLLLSMLYKIETGYEDYKKVKVNVCSKNQFVKEILETIENRCKKIEFIKPTDEMGKKLYENGLNCEINKEEGTIKTFQNEKSILDAIMQMRQEDIEIKDKYGIFIKPLKEMLLIGNNMNSLELITDFNGWSWDITVSGRKNMIYNNLYQHILLLLGNKKIESWINNRKIEVLDELPSNVILSSKYNETFGITKKEIIGEEIDYVEEIRYLFRDKYGEELEKKFFTDVIKIAILECSKRNENYKKEILKEIAKVDKELKKMKDNKKFIEELSKQKEKITKEIQEIDYLLSNEKQLKKEYDARNSKLSNKDKIFSVSHFRLLLQKQRKNKLEEIKKINKNMRPEEYVKIKSAIEEKMTFYEDINIEEYTKENFQRLFVNLEKTFLECLNIKIENAKENEQIENLLYELRYYKHMPTLLTKSSINTKELEFKIIQKAIDQKILTKLSEEYRTNFIILKEIFTTKIIDIDTITFILKFSKGIITLDVYDGNTHDETKQIKLTEKTELCVKLNKKIKIWQ